MSLNLQTDTIRCPKCGHFKFSEEIHVRLHPDTDEVKLLDHIDASRIRAHIKSQAYVYKCTMCRYELRRGKDGV